MAQNVVITGSTKGIGFGLAREFNDRGHSVVITGRTQEAVDQAVSKLPHLDAALGVVCDVAVETDVRELCAQTISAFGSIDIWINNAGLARTVWPILETPADQIEAMLTTNMFGTITCSRIAAAEMVAQGHGKLFTMLGGGSDGEYFPGMGIYGTTKRGLDYFTDALAKELADTAVLVGKIRPGMVITEGVVREAQANLENFQKNRSRMNNLVDTVETVSPYLVDQILAFSESGKKIRWMTPAKIMGRLIKGIFTKRPDQFAPFGL